MMVTVTIKRRVIAGWFDSMDYFIGDPETHDNPLVWITFGLYEGKRMLPIDGAEPRTSINPCSARWGKVSNTEILRAKAAVFQKAQEVLAQIAEDFETITQVEYTELEKAKKGVAA